MIDRRLRIWETAALAALCLALCTGTWAQHRQERLSGNIVRLHVLAHSDSPQEQRIKLRVRDAVLEYLEPGLSAAESAPEAADMICGHMEDIARAAFSASGGRAVQVSLSRESYPTRQYGSLALPGGEYCSLRVVLGDGRGENWWCVVFPPLCSAAVTGEEPLPAMNQEDMELMSRKGAYRLGFRSMELWNGLKEKLKTDD